MESSSLCAYPQGLKSIVNEKFGDGIMSAIDFYLTVDKVSARNVETIYEYHGEFLKVQLPREANTQTSRAAGSPPSKRVTEVLTRVFRTLAVGS